jgi:hypothetical protein
MLPRSMRGLTHLLGLDLPSNLQAKHVNQLEQIYLTIQLKLYSKLNLHKHMLYWYYIK